MPGPSDVMTQRHQKSYELIDPRGTVWQSTTSRTTAAGWHARCLHPDPLLEANDLRFRVRTSKDVWFSSANADAAALGRWEADMDRRHGM
jgi:hypothetical protein